MDQAFASCAIPSMDGWCIYSLGSLDRQTSSGTIRIDVVGVVGRRFSRTHGSWTRVSYSADNGLMTSYKENAHTSPSTIFLHGSIVAARNALFPETILDTPNSAGTDGNHEDDITQDDDDLEDLLAELGAWQIPTKDTDFPSSFVSESSSPDVLTDELQSWRKQHVENPYDEWSEDRKQEFRVSLTLTLNFYFPWCANPDTQNFLFCTVMATVICSGSCPRIFDRLSGSRRNEKEHIRRASSNSRQRQ